MIEEGVVSLPGEAIWLGAFKTELLGFPNARHDVRLMRSRNR